MAVQPTYEIEDRPAGDGAGAYPGEFTPEERERGQNAFWWTLAVLYRRRYVLLGVALATGIASVVFSLTLPLWYRAETRVLLPQTGGSSMLSMLESVVPGAGSLIGGKGGDYTRFLSILTSRTLLDRTVEEFELEAVYETQAAPDPRAEAIRSLLGNTEFEVALDYDYLSVAVLDRDPERAAAMANFMVRQLNLEHIRLTSANARQNRVFIGQRLDEAQAALDSAQADLQAFQEVHGILDVERQGGAFFEVLAQARAQVAQLEIQYGTLRRQYGEANPQTQMARDALAAARATVSEALSGNDALMPVPLRDLPGVSRQYAERYQEVVTQATIVEFIMPLYEQARFDEEREAVAVQVLDEAIAPKRKAKPKRALVVLSLTFSVLVLVTFFLLARAWWREHAAEVARRLHSA